MSVWDPTTHLTVTEAELLEGLNVDEALMTKLGSNQEYAEAQRLLQVNAWTKGSDTWSHFNKAASADDFTLINAPSLDQDNHLYSMSSGVVQIITVAKHRADTVETIVEARVKNSAHSATDVPVIGHAMASGATAGNEGSDYVGFINGTNANTYKAISKSGGTIRTTTDNLAADYLNWHDLRVEYFTAGAKFYIDGSLVATHTTLLPDTVLLFAIWGMSDRNTSTTKFDWVNYRAIANDVSP